MRKTGWRILACAVCVFAAVMIAGCEEENLSKREKLIAVEKNTLKKQLQDRDTKIEELQQQMEERKATLAKCEEEKKQAEQSSGKRTEQTMLLLFETLGKENKKLKEENAELNTQIEALKKQ